MLAGDYSVEHHYTTWHVSTVCTLMLGQQLSLQVDRNRGFPQSNGSVDVILEVGTGYYNGVASPNFEYSM